MFARSQVALHICIPCRNDPCRDSPVFGISQSEVSRDLYRLASRTVNLGAADRVFLECKKRAMSCLITKTRQDQRLHTSNGNSDF